MEEEEEKEEVVVENLPLSLSGLEGKKNKIKKESPYLREMGFSTDGRTNAKTDPPPPTA